MESGSTLKSSVSNAAHSGVGLGPFPSLSKVFGSPNATSLAAKIHDIES